MPRIGITGHTNLTPTTEALVADNLRTAFATYPASELTGVTCLARGADQVFAQVVLGLGGRVEVVLPAADYRDRVVEQENRARFDDLLDRSAAVRTMAFAESSPDAYMAASEHMLSTVDSMVAVWDGRPSGGYGGTADVVNAAQQRGIHVRVVWPVGSSRA